MLLEKTLKLILLYRGSTIQPSLMTTTKPTSLTVTRNSAPPDSRLLSDSVLEPRDLRYLYTN